MSNTERFPPLQPSPRLAARLEAEVAPAAESGMLAALQDTWHGEPGRYEQQLNIMRTVADIAPDPTSLSGLSPAQRARNAYGRLRQYAESGGGSLAIAGNTSMLADYHQAISVLDPDTLATFSIHHNLCIPTITGLGTGSDYENEILDKLDKCEIIGNYLATETAHGTDVSNLETTFTYDPKTRNIVFSTGDPDGDLHAAKLMPNTAEETVPKAGPVLGRFLVPDSNGELVDQGVFAFLVPIRDENGTTEGIKVKRLPDGMVAMDNGQTSADNVVLPFEAWLPGGIAKIDENGQFHSDMPIKQRFEVPLKQVSLGRVLFPGAATAMAGGALYETTRFMAQRTVEKKPVPLLDQDNIVETLGAGYAQAFAIRTLSNLVHKRFVEHPEQQQQNERLAMATKAVISNTAADILAANSDLDGLQGMLSVNMLPLWHAAVKGLRIAEGHNDAMDMTHGSIMYNKGVVIPSLEEQPAESSWIRNFMTAREQGMLTKESFENSSATGSKSYAKRIGQAAGERLAYESLSAAVHRTDHPQAKDLIQKLADAYALGRIEKNYQWYAENRPDLIADRKISATLGKLHQEIGSQALLLSSAVMPGGLLHTAISDDYVEWLKRYHNSES